MVFMETKELELTTLPRIFIHVVRRFKPIFIRNPAIAVVAFSSRDSDSASCLYRPSSLLLRQRKLPLYTDALVCRPGLTS